MSKMAGNEEDSGIERFARLVTGEELAHVVSSASLNHLNRAPAINWNYGKYVITPPPGASGRIEALPTDEFVLMPVRMHDLPGRPLQYRCEIYDVYGDRLFSYLDVLGPEYEALTIIDQD